MSEFPTRATGREADALVDHPEDRRLARASTVISSRRRPRSWELREDREADAQLNVDQLLHQFNNALGGILSALSGPPMDSVLTTTSATMPAAGSRSWTFPINYASIAIANLSAGELVISSGSVSPDGNAPGRSTGVVWIPAGMFRVIGLRSNVLTIYGAAGANFDFTAYSRPQPPTVGPCGQG